jgi:dihydroorotate dehydrogenase
MYKSLIRPLLFLVDPEKIHHFVFSVLRLKGKVPGFKWLLRTLFVREDPRFEKEVFGIRFKNRVGLAAGFDKDARLIDAMACLGFGLLKSER